MINGIVKHMNSYFHSALNNDNFFNNIFENWNFQGIKIKNCNFEGAVFHGCKFDKADIESCNFNNSIVKHCSFVESNLIESTFDNALFDTCNFSSARIVSLLKIIKNISFISSIFNSTYISHGMDKAYFQKCSLSNGTFKNMELKKIYFDYSTTTKLTFENCLVGGLFQGLDLSKVEYKDSDISGLVHDYDSCKGQYSYLKTWDWKGVERQLKEEVAS